MIVRDRNNAHSQPCFRRLDENLRDLPLSLPETAEGTAGGFPAAHHVQFEMRTHQVHPKKQLRVQFDVQPADGSEAGLVRINTSTRGTFVADGIIFDSGPELEHYQNLKALQRAGKISQLQYAPKFTFIVNDVKIGTYKPDFTFRDNITGYLRVQDVKGWKRSPKTGRMLPRVDRGFNKTKALMKACFGLTVEIV